MIITLASQAGDVLASGGGTDPWAQRLTAGAALVTAILGGIGTFAAFVQAGRQKGNRAVRDAEDDNTPLAMDPEQMAEIMEIMLRRQRSSSTSTQPLHESAEDEPQNTSSDQA